MKIILKCNEEIVDDFNDVDVHSIFVVMFYKLKKYLKERYRLEVDYDVETEDSHI